MPDPSSVSTIRAAVDAILPGDGVLPAASELGVHEHVVALGEQYLTGFADVIAALLDAYAADAGGASFAALDADGRRRALRAMAADESADVRDAADALFTFAYGGMYSEWTGLDRPRRRLRPPAAWERVGFHGPSRGHPAHAEPSDPPGAGGDEIDVDAAP